MISTSVPFFMDAIVLNESSYAARSPSTKLNFASRVFVSNTKDSALARLICKLSLLGLLPLSV